MRKMSENNNHGLFGISDVMIIILFGIIGYFVYDSVSLSLAIVVLTILYSFTMLFSMIPILGVVTQYLLMKFVIFPIVISLTGLYVTWLTTAIFWVFMIFGIIVNISVSVLVYMAIKDR